jgi:hypothetical protein
MHHIIGLVDAQGTKDVATEMLKGKHSKEIVKFDNLLGNYSTK